MRPFEQLCENLKEIGLCYDDYSSDGYLEFGLDDYVGGVTQILNNRVVEEGLIRSYPADKVIKLLRQEFRGYIWSIKSIDVNSVGVITARAGVDLDTDMVEKMKGRLDSWGYVWSLGNREFKQNDSILIEAKYPIDVTDEVNNSGLKIYHVAPKIYDEKIQKIGLIPKDSSSDFNFSGRIYLFTNTSQLSDINLQQTMVEILQQNQKKCQHDEWSVYEIDGSGLKFHHDWFVRPDNLFSFFTLQNIHPDRIKNIGGISS